MVIWQQWHFCFFCEKFGESEHFPVGIEVLTLLFVTIYAVLLYLHRTGKSSYQKPVLAMVTIVVLLVECILNTDFTKMDTTSRGEYLDSLTDYDALYKWTSKQEDSFYRLEEFICKTANDGALVGYPTATVFSSAVNFRVMEWYKRLGMKHSIVSYGFDGATAFTSALLNVNYMFGEKDTYENPLYKLVQQSNAVYLYESKARLPFGYVAPLGYDLPDSEEYEKNGLALQNAMVHELRVEETLFEEVSAEQAENNVVFTTRTPGIYYGLLTSDDTKKVEVMDGSWENREFAGLKQGAVLYLDYMQEGESITLVNGDTTDSTPQIAVAVYRMNLEAVSLVIFIIYRIHRIV